MKKIMYSAITLMAFVCCIIKSSNFFIRIQNNSSESIRVKVVKEKEGLLGFKFWVQIGKTIEIAKGLSKYLDLYKELSENNTSQLDLLEELDGGDVKFLIAYSRKGNRGGLQYWGNTIDVSSFKKKVSRKNGLKIEIKNIEKKKKEGVSKGITRLVSGNKLLQHTCFIQESLKMLDTLLLKEEKIP